MRVATGPLIVVSIVLLCAACVEEWDPDGSDSSTDTTQDSEPDAADTGEDTAADTVVDAPEDTVDDTATEPSPECGDGVREGDEECDDGDDGNSWEPDACRPDCTLPTCGDGVVDPDFGEQCEDDMTEPCDNVCNVAGLSHCDPDECTYGLACVVDHEVCDNGCDDDVDGSTDCADDECTCVPACLFHHETDFSGSADDTDWSSSVPANLYVDTYQEHLHTYLYIQDDGYITHPLPASDQDIVTAEADFYVPSSGLQFVQGAIFGFTTNPGDAVDWRAQRNPRFDGKSIHARLFYQDHTAYHHMASLRAVDAAGDVLAASSAEHDLWGPDLWFHLKLEWDGAARMATMEISDSAGLSIINEAIDLSEETETYDIQYLEIAVAARAESYTNHITFYWDNVVLDVLPADCM